MDTPMSVESKRSHIVHNSICCCGHSLDTLLLDRFMFEMYNSTHTARSFTSTFSSSDYFFIFLILVYRTLQSFWI